MSVSKKIFFFKVRTLLSLLVSELIRKKSTFGDHGSKFKKLELNPIHVPGQITGMIGRVHVAQKRFNTRGKLRGIRISRLAKISTLYRDWLR